MMYGQEILVADDQPGKLQHFEDLARGAAGSKVHVHRAASAAEALRIINSRGKNIGRAVFDFDFLGENHCGADLVAAQRKINARTHITCATARERGRGFEEAQGRTLAAGANEVICAVEEEFDEKLTEVLATAA